MRIALILAMLATGSAVHAEPRVPIDPPQRMPGLWLMTTSIDGIPDAVGDFHICVDNKGEDAPLGHPSLPPSDCPDPQWHKDKARSYYTASCKAGDSRVSAKGAFFGDFEYTLQGELTLEYDPPLDGRAEITVRYDGRRLGPCKETLKRGVFLIKGQDGIGNLNLSQ